MHATWLASGPAANNFGKQLGAWVQKIMNTQPNVHFVTNWELLQWMQAPKSIAQYTPACLGAPVTVAPLPPTTVAPPPPTTVVPPPPTTVAPPPPTTQAVTHFSLFNADTNLLVPAYEKIVSNMNIALDVVGSSMISLLALTTPDVVGSVAFYIDGVLVQTENAPVYALKGNSGDDLLGFAVSAGKSYVFSAVPFTLKNRKGTKGTALTVTLTFVATSAPTTVAPPPPTTVAPPPPTTVAPPPPTTAAPPPPTTIAPPPPTTLAPPPPTTLAPPPPTTVAPPPPTTIAPPPPTTLAPPPPTTVAPPPPTTIAPPPPTTTIAPPPPTTLAPPPPTTVAPPVVVTTTSTLSVAYFALYNAATDKIVPGYEQITGNTAIDLAAVGSRDISLLALTNPGVVGSVVFQVDGVKKQTENLPVYALAGNLDDDLLPFTVTADRAYTFTAIPFSSANGKGLRGTSLTVKLDFFTTSPVFDAQANTVAASVTANTTLVALVAVPVMIVIVALALLAHRRRRATRAVNRAAAANLPLEYDESVF